MCRCHFRLILALSQSLCLMSPTSQAAGGQGTRRPQPVRVWGFTGPWDARSTSSVRAYGSQLDGVITGWIAFDSATASPIQPFLFPDTVRPRQGTLRRMAIVTSWHGDRFHPRTVRTLASDPARLGTAAALIARHAAAMRYQGLVLDFESLSAADVGALVTVVRAIADSAHRLGVRPIAVAIPATDTVAYPARRLLEVADLIMPMLYDQHWSGGEPGPVADPTWVHQTLSLRIAEAGGPDRVVAALPTYGYRWWKGRPTDEVSYPEARQIAATARVPLERDPATRTVRAAVPGSWEMWVTDAGLLRVLVRDAQAAGIRRFALWRMGQEDPAVWSAVFR